MSLSMPTVNEPLVEHALLSGINKYTVEEMEGFKDFFEKTPLGAWILANAALSSSSGTGGSSSNSSILDSSSSSSSKKSRKKACICDDQCAMVEESFKTVLQAGYRPRGHNGIVHICSF